MRHMFPWYQIFLYCLFKPWQKEIAWNPSPSTALRVYGQTCPGGNKPKLGKSDNVQIRKCIPQCATGLSSKRFLLPFHPLNYLNRIHSFSWRFCAYCTSAPQYKTQINIKARKLIWLPHLLGCVIFFNIYDSWSSLWLILKCKYLK